MTIYITLKLKTKLLNKSSIDAYNVNHYNL